MLFYHPKVKTHRAWEHTPFHVMDIPATILDITKTDYPSKYKGRKILPMEGKSMLPALKAEKKDLNRELYFEHEGNRGYRQGKWKMVYSNYSKNWKLYDLDSDRSESKNMAKKHPELVQEFSKKWDKWAERCYVEKEKVSSPSKGMPKIYYEK